MLDPIPLLTLTDVRIRFGDTQALAGLSPTAHAGQVTVILGPNGAGKTTMVRCCTGLHAPDSGQISIVGGPPGTPRAQAEVAVMPQFAGTWNAITARELLVHLGTLYANPHPADALMELLGITHVARTPYRRLSGGQQQSLNLAAALIGRPRLVFLDEPTAGLDLHVRERVWQVIRTMRDSGVAVVLSTHVMDEAEALADQVWILNAGQVSASGTVAELTTTQTLAEVFLSTTTPGGL